MKTAREILQTNPNWSEQDPNVIEAMQIYGMQVAKELREAFTKAVLDYLEEPVYADDELFQQGIKRALLEMGKIDINEFII